jgi:hypothetical protein
VGLKPLRRLNQELGRMAVIWAEIEQNLILHASAMAAEQTDGWPREYLRLDFKRLREKWLSFTTKMFPDKKWRRIFNPLNESLVKSSRTRNFFTHGTWKYHGAGIYSLSWFEQKDDLKNYVMTTTIREIQDFNCHLESILAELETVSFGHRREDR